MKHPLRLFQSLTLLLAGLYGLFVFVGNLMDYDSNFQFVRHVLSMDTTFEGNALMWRAIDNEVIHHIAYWGIILAEGAFAALALIAAARMFFARDGDLVAVGRAKAWGFSAYGIGLLIWFFGFIIIGSEWFAMWQSATWNGKDTAMPLAILWAVFAAILAMNESVVTVDTTSRRD